MLARLVVSTALVTAALTWSLVVAFRHPDDTVARRWIGHPGEMGITLGLALLAALVAHWPRR